MGTMRVVFLLCVAFFSSLTAGISLSDSPQCALPCLVEVLKDPSMSNQSYTDICKNKDFAASVTDCSSEACSLQESMKFKDVISSFCKVASVDNRQEYRAIIIVFATLSFAFVALRLASEVLVKTSWGADDTWAVVTFFILIPCTAFMLLTIESGFGSLTSMYQSHTVTQLFKNIFLWQIFLMAGLSTARTSILFFYLRIFPDGRFRIVVWITIAFNFISTITIIVLNFTLGQSVKLIWAGGSDYNANNQKNYMAGIKIVLGHCVVNLVLDIWMLVLPMTQLYNLGLRLNKKIRVMSMFGMGLFLTAVSIVRTALQIKIVPEPSEADNTLHAAVILASIELYVGVVVACVPAARQLFKTALSKVKPKEQASSKASRKPVFVDRSLEPITNEEDTLTFHTDGGLTTTTISSTTTKGRDIEMDIVSNMERGNSV